MDPSVTQTPMIADSMYPVVDPQALDKQNIIDDIVEETKGEDQLQFSTPTPAPKDGIGNPFESSETPQADDEDGSAADLNLTDGSV